MPDGSQLEIDHHWRWIMPGEGLRTEMDGKRWIPSRAGSLPAINHDQIWLDNRWWMTGDRTQQMDLGR